MLDITFCTTRWDPVNELQERIRYLFSLGVSDCLSGQLADLSDALKEDLQKTGIEAVVRRRYQLLPPVWENLRKMEILPRAISMMVPSIYTVPELATAWQKNPNIVSRWANELKQKKGAEYVVRGPDLNALQRLLEADSGEER